MWSWKQAPSPGLNASNGFTSSKALEAFSCFVLSEEGVLTQRVEDDFGLLLVPLPNLLNAGMTGMRY